MKKSFVLCFLLIYFLNHVSATDYYVNAVSGNNTTGDGTYGNPWQTITYALGMVSGEGHTLNVAAGTYDATLGESFPIQIKDGISLSGAGIDISIIHGISTASVIKCVAILNQSTQLSGFTITGGGGTLSGSYYYGGGIYISAGSVLILANNRITSNVLYNAWGAGAGIYITNAAPRILNNIIDLNSSGTFGDGCALYIASGTPLIKGNRITGNYNSTEDDMGSIVVYGAARIINNLIANNPETGIYCGANAQIINNTISDNGRHGIYVTSGAHPDSVYNNIISLNTGYGIYESGTNSDPGKVWYNLLYSNGSGIYFDEGTTDYYSSGQLNTNVPECKNNIHPDPLFTDKSNGDYHLRAGSPAIDAGDPAYDFSNEPDPNGGRINMGAYGNTSDAETSEPGPPALPENLYVNASTGSDNTGDGSEGNPWKTITFALDQVTTEGHTINVAAGTYDATLGESFPILMKDGVTLIGAGNDQSIIDGQAGASVIKCISILNESSLLSGFTITGGGGTLVGSEYHGGGIYISGGSMLTISGNRITGNTLTDAWGTGGGFIYC